MCRRGGHRGMEHRTRQLVEFEGEGNGEECQLVPHRDESRYAEIVLIQDMDGSCHLGEICPSYKAVTLAGD